VYPFLVELRFEEFWLRIPTFGVLLAFAFSSAYFLSLSNAKKLEIPHRTIEILFLIIVLSSAFGARLFHVIFEDPQYYLRFPQKIFAVWEGGFTFYGALLLAIVSIISYCKWKKLPLGTILDIAGTSTILSLAIGRLGCFFAGCCWGKLCHLPWGIRFTHPQGFTPDKIQALHPTQLYESLGAFIIFIFAQRSLARQISPGMLSMKILLASSFLRFLIEFLRGDHYRGYLIPSYLSYSQGISLLLIAFSLLILKRKRLL